VTGQFYVNPKLCGAGRRSRKEPALKRASQELAHRCAGCYHLSPARGMVSRRPVQTQSGARELVVLQSRIMPRVPAGYYTLYPRGVGAAKGPMPNGYVMVSRWVSVAEAKLWMMNAVHTSPLRAAGGESTLLSMACPVRLEPMQFGSTLVFQKLHYKWQVASTGASWSKTSQTCQSIT
jgi:hypothetical protein